MKGDRGRTARGAWAREARTALGLTQVEMAGRLGLTGNTLARIERGELLLSETAALLLPYLAREAGVELPPHPPLPATGRDVQRGPRTRPGGEDGPLPPSRAGSHS